MSGVKKEVQHEEQRMNKTLYVKGFGLEWSEVDMFNVFKQFGEIESLKLGRGKKGQGLGFGYVTFLHEESAFQAQENLHLSYVLPSGNILQVQEFKRKGERGSHKIRSTNDSVQNHNYPLLTDERKSLLKTELESAKNNPKQSRQIMGEVIFPIIYVKYPELAGKITGMLLELELSELLLLLDSDLLFYGKIDEALEMLLKFRSKRELKNRCGGKQKSRISSRNTADPSQQKQLIGETIYPDVHAKYPERAGKITGMLLELPIDELLLLLDSHVLLGAKMEEAFEVLEGIELKNVPIDGVRNGRIENPSLKPDSDRNTEGRENSEISFVRKENDSIQISLSESGRTRINETKQAFLGADDPVEQVRRELDGLRVDGSDVTDLVYETARGLYANEANLIAKLVAEKCNGEQLQLLASSRILLEHEVEKAHIKIQKLQSPPPVRKSKV